MDLLKKVLKKGIPVLLWLVIWQLAALIIHNKILLAGPIETVRALISLSGTADFWESVAESTWRILSL